MAILKAKFNYLLHRPKKILMNFCRSQTTCATLINYIEIHFEFNMLILKRKLLANGFVMEVDLTRCEVQ